jgi:hypothetical protein
VSLHAKATKRTLLILGGMAVPMSLAGLILLAGFELIPGWIAGVVVGMVLLWIIYLQAVDEVRREP